MRFETWERYYLEIVRFFGFDTVRDSEAADILADLVTDKKIVGPEVLREAIEGKGVYVFGGGPSIKAHLDEYEFPGVLISADSATSALVEKGLRPDIIVSDLDGNVSEQVDLNKEGAIMLIHAHGDNIPALKEWVDKFEGRIVPTCQSQPLAPLQNFGGFTDGDRAVFLADHFEARSIHLVGFDFQSFDSAYKEMDAIKVKKLDWAQVLIAMLDNPTIQFIDEDRPIMSLN
jgi:uncharacterized Rossmann fold enzyme